MAKQTEMDTLALNPAMAIENTFTPIGRSFQFINNGWLAVDVFSGRYDKVASLHPPSHKQGIMDWNVTDNTIYFPTNGSNMFLGSSISDAGWGGQGAWAVTNNYTPQRNTVPEPSTMLLIGSGLVWLAAFRRKFRV